MKLKTFISMISILFLLTASLSGCGSTEIAEASDSPESQQESLPEQEDGQKQKDNIKNLEKMEITTIPDADIEMLLQAGMDAVADESDLWAISAITDAEVLMQLTQFGGGKEHPEGEAGEVSENMTPPDGEAGQRPDGEMPEVTIPERSGENSPENMEGSFPDGEKPEGGHDRGEGGRRSGNRGGGMASLAIVISGTENTTLEAEDIFAHIQLTAEELGYQASSMELTEEQHSVTEVPDGHSVKMVVLINTKMPEMEAGEAVG